MAAPVRLAFSVLKNKSTLKLFTHQSSLRLRTHCIVGRSLTYEHWNRVEKWHQSHYYEKYVCFRPRAIIKVSVAPQSKPKVSPPQMPFDNSQFDNIW